MGYDAFHQCDVYGWTRIVQVAGGGYHTVGLKSDGTVVAVRRSSAGQLDVGDWTGIVQVAAGGFHTVGLKADGTVVAVGSNGLGQCNFFDWDLN
jgi:alpha-tubulin suppressor-like RCC1 family protein